MMLFLYDRYGIGFMSRLHRDGEHQGLVGVQRALDGSSENTDVYDVIHDFQVSTLVDRYVDRSKRGKVKGISKAGSPRRVRLDGQPGQLRLRTPPGGSANGADYVGLRAGTGSTSRADLKSVSFAARSSSSRSRCAGPASATPPAVTATRPCGRATRPTPTRRPSCP